MIRRAARQAGRRVSALDVLDLLDPVVWIAVVRSLPVLAGQ